MFIMFANYCNSIRHICRVRLLVPCLLFFCLSNFVQAQTPPTTSDVIYDTCYVTHKGDSLLVVVATSRFFDGDKISFYVSLVKHQLRSEGQMVPRFLPEEGLTMLTRRTKQINLYLRSHKEYIKQYTESTIRHLLPAGTESKIKEFFPYEFRDLTFDIDKDGYIIAAKLYIRNPVQFILFGSVQGCGDILKALIGKQLPAQQLPTIGNGFQLHLPFFKVNGND